MLEQCTFCNSPVESEELTCSHCNAKKSKSVYKAIKFFYIFWILVFLYDLYLLYKIFYRESEWLIPIVVGIFVFLLILLNKLKKLPENAPYDHFVKDGVKK